MPTNVLTGKINIDASAAVKEINNLGVSVNKAGQTLKTLGNTTASAGADLGKLPAVLSNVGDGANKAAGGLGDFAKSAASMAAGFLGGHGVLFAIEFVGHALIDMAKEFLSSKDAILEAKIAAGQFAEALEQVGKDADKLKASLDFKGEIDKLKFEIAGFSGFKLDKLVFGETVINNQKLAEDLDGRIALLERFKRAQVSQLKDIRDAAIKIGQVDAKNKVFKIAEAFPDLTKVPKSLLGEFPEQIQAFIEQAKTTSEELADLQKSRVAVTQQTIKATLDIVNKGNKEQIRLDKEAATAYEKYVTDTIAQAKRLESKFPALLKDPSSVTEHGVKILATSVFTALDSRAEQLKKAIKLIKDFKTDKANNFDRGQRGLGVFAEQVKLKIPPIEIPPPTKEQVDKLSTLFKGFTIPVKLVPVDVAEKLHAIEQISAGIGRTISDNLAGAMNDFVDAIADGANVFTAFGQLVKGVIKGIITDLIKAVALAGVLSLLGLGGGVNPKNFLQTLGGLFGGARAAGGPVSQGKGYIVGENGPEWFLPNSGGTIIPNGGNMGNVAGLGGGGILSAMVRGKDLLFVLNQAGASNSRLA